MPAPQTVARDAQDMRERRDMDRLGSHLVSPGPPVSYDYAVGVVSCVPHARTIEVLACQHSFPAVC